jgi:hypothetical protein
LNRLTGGNTRATDTGGSTTRGDDDAAGAARIKE